MVTTLLTTKLHKPLPTTYQVLRPRLTQRLEEGLRVGHRLFLVVAPAGYGKTTLVADWLSKTDAPSTWLSLDEADNDPIRFFTYFIAALKKILSGKLTGPLQESFAFSPESPEAFILPLINDLVTIDHPILLVLDDYHLVTADAVHEAMVLLLRRAPPALHLVVLSRVDPPFPLSRLRVRERMTEIRDRDLRFTTDEMTTLLNSMHNLNLSGEQITALESRTEGWAASVQLAGLSMQGCSQERVAEFISDFGGSHHYIVDYLFEEVLNRQPDHVREFLLRTSILERMCAPLCEVIMTVGVQHVNTGVAVERNYSTREILEFLGRSHLFLIPLDDERYWYRYHHLFVDVLRQYHKSISPPDHIACLHRCASEWYQDNGFTADAIHHALQAYDNSRAAKIVEENAWSMVLQGELAALKTWIQALPEQSVSGQPWLCIYYAWALLFQESETAELQLKAAEKHLQAGEDQPLRAEMHGHITAIRAWIANQQGDQEQAVLLARQALDLCPVMDASVRSGLMRIIATGCLLDNDLAGCKNACLEAVELARSSNNIMLEVAARTLLGDLHFLMGHLREAEVCYQDALQRAILYNSPVAAQAYLCLARIHREWNDLDAARIFAEKTVQFSEIWGHVDALAAGHILLALILHVQGKFLDANHALAEANRIIREHPNEIRSMAWPGANRARLWLAQGAVEDTLRWSESRGLSGKGKINLRNEVEYTTLVRIYLAEHLIDDALRLLTSIQEAIGSTERQGSLIEVYVLRACAYQIQGNLQSALSDLEQAIGIARFEGYVRLFLDEGQPVKSLLKIAATQWQDESLLAYARKLLKAFAEESDRCVADQTPPTTILSNREVEVLNLLSSGCSNKEIADNLVIAIGTTKRHIANIFNKLDVRNRTEAVAKARWLELL